MLFHDLRRRIRLIEAAATGDVAVVQRMLDAGADPNGRARGMTPLIRALLHRQLGAAVLLIDRGADLDLRSRTGGTLLHIAAFRGPAEMVQLLLDLGADLEARDDQGETPLVLAVKCGQIDAARLLLEHGADPEARGEGHFSALVWAAFNLSPELVRLLLDHGAKAAAKVPVRYGIGSVIDRTPLEMARLHADIAARNPAGTFTHRSGPKSAPERLRAATAIIAMLRDAGATE